MNSLTDQPRRKVIQVVPLEQGQVRVYFDSGETMLLDLSDLLHRRDSYWRLRHPRYFQQVAIDPLGGLCWPEGEDLAPDGLERYACLPPASFSD